MEKGAAEKKEETVTKPKMRPEVSLTLIFTLAGMAAGLVALYARVQTRFMVALGIFVLMGLMFGARKVYKKDWRWIATNGLFAYILTFYATWVIAINV